MKSGARHSGVTIESEATRCTSTVDRRAGGACSNVLVRRKLRQREDMVSTRDDSSYCMSWICGRGWADACRMCLENRGYDPWIDAVIARPAGQSCMRFVTYLASLLFFEILLSHGPVR